MQSGSNLRVDFSEIPTDEEIKSFVNKHVTAMSSKVIEDIKNNCSDTVDEWILNKWTVETTEPFDWDDESDVGTEEYYQAYIHTLNNGHFREFFEEAFEKVTGLSLK
ncbi:hypothetical protein [Bacillus litorisediminis]|uniref:hypothetical protein n=1 Tax=Bacillus litorisediminis TaxID=2922713 RepID=UPI001FADE82B|nr:hypothetical protein [Bacillus litorisediminis]